MYRSIIIDHRHVLVIFESSEFLDLTSWYGHRFFQNGPNDSFWTWRSCQRSFVSIESAATLREQVIQCYRRNYNIRAWNNNVYLLINFHSKHCFSYMSKSAHTHTHSNTLSPYERFLLNDCSYDGKIWGILIWNSSCHEFKRNT